MIFKDQTLKRSDSTHSQQLSVSTSAPSTESYRDLQLQQQQQQQSKLIIPTPINLSKKSHSTPNPLTLTSLREGLTNIEMTQFHFQDSLEQPFPSQSFPNNKCEFIQNSSNNSKHRDLIESSMNYMFSQFYKTKEGQLFQFVNMMSLANKQNEELEKKKIERKEKIQRYLEKKAKRNWNVLRYQVRKTIAKQRNRVKGRFVREEKMEGDEEQEEEQEQDEKQIETENNDYKNSQHYENGQLTNESEQQQQLKNAYQIEDEYHDNDIEEESEQLNQQFKCNEQLQESSEVTSTVYVNQPQYKNDIGNFTSSSTSTCYRQVKARVLQELYSDSLMNIKDNITYNKIEFANSENLAIRKVNKNGKSVIKNHNNNNNNNIQCENKENISLQSNFNYKQTTQSQQQGKLFNLFKNSQYYTGDNNMLKKSIR